MLISARGYTGRSKRKQTQLAHLPLQPRESRSLSCLNVEVISIHDRLHDRLTVSWSQVEPK